MTPLTECSFSVTVSMTPLTECSFSVTVSMTLLTECSFSVTVSMTPLTECSFSVTVSMNSVKQVNFQYYSGFKFWTTTCSWSLVWEDERAHTSDRTRVHPWCISVFISTWAGVSCHPPVPETPSPPSAKSWRKTACVCHQFSSPFSLKVGVRGHCLATLIPQFMKC